MIGVRKHGILQVIVALLLAAFAGAQNSPSGTPYRLTLSDAIQRGLRANLAPQLAEARIAEAQGTEQRGLATLLPHARIDNAVALQSRSLKAQGISIPILPDVVGPFSTYDFRVYADQTLIDRQAYHNYKATRISEQGARRDYQNARDSVIRQIAELYLSVESAAAQTAAARSRLDTSETLYKLAHDQYTQGIATGIDVLRAQVQAANDRQAVLEARNTERIYLLTLARNIGMTPGTPIELTTTLEYVPLPVPDIDNAVRDAMAARPDLQSLLKQKQALEEQLRASKARYLPRLSVSGNYGGIGRAVGQVAATGQIQADLTFTVFDRDRKGEQMQIESRIRGVERRIADLRLGIDQEIRQATLNLESAADEVNVAKAGLDLAQKELTLARSRFEHGVADNVEVVNAQDAFARAQQNEIRALTRHVDAKIALARALGNTEKNYAAFLGMSEVSPEKQ